MAKYAEVKERQSNVAMVQEKEEPFGRGVWVGFTFKKNGPGMGGMTGSGFASAGPGGDGEGVQVEEPLETIF